ncbi:protein kinase [Tahibacter sp.]|uniref:protein kinase domain-containing protein n=1 Tax=Tahibacter sp. TaxID=2056211 RepID=UPI0028C42A9F|nr:protein kinase [Tahibacter sp.]
MDATVNTRVTPIISGKGLQSDLAPGNALVAGMRLREFEIIETLGEGGFSIVYGARDLQLMRDVAIKEYIPISLAGRVATTTVRIRSEHNRETFEAGLNGFINEARLLAQFKHPGLVEVLQFWEENGTAYMVMPRYTGKTLRSVLKDMGGKGDEPWLRGVVAPVLDVLDLLHSRNVFHRDIAPDNILIKNDGTPVLLDLGSAREVVTGLQKAITVVVKPGYAPIEQYSSDFALPQGPWTDVYAVGALLHFAIVGCPPPASISRIMKDSLQPLSAAGLSGYSREFLTAVDRALALQPGDRPQSIAELRDLLRVTENDRTIINFAPPPLIPPAIIAAAPATAPTPPIVEPVALDIDLPGSEDERTVIVSAQEVAALVQQLAGAKAAAAANAAAASAAEMQRGKSTDPAVPVAVPTIDAVTAEAEAAAGAPVETAFERAPEIVAIAPLVAAAASVVREPAEPVVADAEAGTSPSLSSVELTAPLPSAVVEPVVEEASIIAEAPTSAIAIPPTYGVSPELPEPVAVSSYELTLEPMVKPEPQAAVEAEPVVVELRIEPVALPPPLVTPPPAVSGPASASKSAVDSPTSAADIDATVVMPVPRHLVEVAKAVGAGAREPASRPVGPVTPTAATAPAMTSDSTVIMPAPDAIALARSVAAAAPPPVAANANEPTIILPSPVVLATPAPSLLDLDPLALVPKQEKPPTNSFPEMEDLLSGRLATDSRPVAVPVIHTPARADLGDRPAVAGSVAAAAPARPWLLPAAGGAALVILATVLTWYLSSGSEAPLPPPIVAETPAVAAVGDTATLSQAPAATIDPLASPSTDPNAVTASADVATMPTPPEAGAAVAPGLSDPAASVAGTSVASIDPAEVLVPLNAPAETTSAGFESPGQTIAPAVAPPPAVVETPPPAPATTPPAAVASVDTVRTVDLTGNASPRGDGASSRPRENPGRPKRETKVASATTGNVKLSIQPWGEVWINGSLKGVSPPVRFLQLEPGTYNVELRNPGLQSLRRQLTVTAGQPVAIEHRFQPAGSGAQ